MATSIKTGDDITKCVLLTKSISIVILLRLVNIHLTKGEKSDWNVKLRVTLVPGGTMVRLPEYVVPSDVKENARGGAIV